MQVETTNDEQHHPYDGLDKNQQGEHNIIIDSDDEDDVYDDGLDYTNIEPLPCESHTC